MTGLVFAKPCFIDFLPQMRYDRGRKAIIKEKAMPNITEAELKKQIKAKNYSPVYLIYGTEQMYVRNYTKRLVDAVAGKTPSDFNFHRFAGDVNLTELAATSLLTSCAMTK